MTTSSRSLIAILSVAAIAGCGTSTDPKAPESVTPTRGPSELNVIAGPEDMTTADLDFVRSLAAKATGLSGTSEYIEAGYQVCQYQHDGFTQTGAEAALAEKYPQLKPGQAKVVVLDVLAYWLCTRGGSAGLVG
ncbi:DUF732 domain-containing protein [Rhodococcus erythropolis]|uniref:DUF732 domain-containing protein n=1 Tax=Rhodococcus erythropolis TaxID=1833 RepID=UPI0037A9C3F2